MKNIFLICFLFLGLVQAQEQNFISKENKINIIELYTSQGCSSCPPADRWLSELKNDPKVFKDYIPMAFHVTYWDYIGWKDKFAKKDFDDRQKIYSISVWQKNALYTPQFVVDAKEYRKWLWDKSFPKLNDSYAGILKASIKDENLKISYKNKELKNKNLLLNMAILGFDYSVPIKKGENSHKILKHDFVVLKHLQEDVKLQNNQLSFDSKIEFKKEPNKKYALVVWLEDYSFGKLQAVGGYLK